MLAKRRRYEAKSSDCTLGGWVRLRVAGYPPRGAPSVQYIHGARATVDDGETRALDSTPQKLNDAAYTIVAHLHRQLRLLIICTIVVPYSASVVLFRASCLPLMRSIRAPPLGQNMPVRRLTLMAMLLSYLVAKRTHPLDLLSCAPIFERRVAFVRCRLILFISDTLTGNQDRFLLFP
jgi:hypothetical protein